MRLNEVRKILQETIGNLNITREDQLNSYSILVNLVPTIDSINRLSHITCFSQTISKIKEMENIYTARTERIIVTTNEAQTFSAFVRELYSQCQTVLALIDSILPPMDENTLCIKVNPTTNISDIKKLISDLDDAFSQISNLEHYKSSVKFAGVESGSDWINLVIVGTSSLIYLLIDKAYQIAHDYNHLKLLDQRYRGAVIQNEVNENNKNLLKAMSAKALQSLENSDGTTLLPEEFERTVLSLQKFSSTIIDGNKILLSLTAPQDKQSHLTNASEQISSQLHELKLLMSSDSDTE